MLGRIVCQLVNQAAFAIGEGVGSADDVDTGLTLGLSHPRGPVARSEAIGLDHVLAVLDALWEERREERYRAAPLLRRAAVLGRSLETDGHGRSHSSRAWPGGVARAIHRGDPTPAAQAGPGALQRHAMGTSLGGTTEDILAVVGELHAVPFEQGVPRVYTVLKLDERRDRPDQTLDDKVRSVEDRLGGDVA